LDVGVHRLADGLKNVEEDGKGYIHDNSNMGSTTTTTIATTLKKS
jgi:hypothetical protein